MSSVGGTNRSGETLSISVETPISTPGCPRSHDRYLKPLLSRRRRTESLNVTVQYSPSNHNAAWMQGRTANDEASGALFGCPTAADDLFVLPLT
jgi:hypothetical protein